MIPRRTTFHHGTFTPPGGIGIEMSDLRLLTSGATGSKVAGTGTANANVGGLVALRP